MFSSRSLLLRVWFMASPGLLNSSPGDLEALCILRGIVLEGLFGSL